MTGALVALLHGLVATIGGLSALGLIFNIRL